MKIVTAKDILNTTILTSGFVMGIWISSLMGYAPHYMLAAIFFGVYGFSCVAANILGLKSKP